MKKINTKELTLIGATAAVYAVLTMIMAPISYGPIQLRLSEIMTLLAFINPTFVPGLVLGTFIANLFSPFGLPDIIFGTLATWIAVYMVSKSKTLFVATLWPTIANGIIIGLMLTVFAGLPFMSTAAYVALGQFIVVTLLGYPIFKVIMKMKVIENLFQN
ncbi:putative membrane protein [Acetoanaerobium pronyense]|uniref:Membrane protein n=1 Tax=Acetoanaerobium pronyense TaxID=1482736 RepID=A0ABS4KM20_9FIRM|nr:QueT transporter family protein [Acetoanaerobium pronyense]MBP2028837.1 putative membrane protein [Acetoanaerobium pronyense]